jgi:hypothetical protein
VPFRFLFLSSFFSSIISGLLLHREAAGVATFFIYPTPPPSGLESFTSISETIRTRHRNTTLASAITYHEFTQGMPNYSPACGNLRPLLHQSFTARVTFHF